MGKITTYPEVTGLTDNQVLLVDGDNKGTKTIKASNAAKELGKRFAGADTFAEAFSNQFDNSEPNRKLVNIINRYIKAFPKDEASGSIAHFIDGADDIPAKIEIDINPIQTGTGDPSPDNVRPISGWTGVKVTRIGKNQLIPLQKNNVIAAGVTCTKNNDGSITLNGTAIATGGITIEANIHINNYKPGTTYYGKLFGENINDLYYQVYADNVAVITKPKGKFTIPNNTSECYTRIRFTEGATFDNVTVRMMCVQGTEEPAEWEPYIGDTYSVNFPSKAGTVYGGKLTINPDGTGELVNNMAYEDLGSHNWIAGNDNAGSYAYANFPNYVNVSDNIICTNYKTVPSSSSASSSTSMPNGTIKGCTTSGNLFVKDYRFTTDAEYNAGLSGVFVAYERENPQTYTLTAEEVTTLFGTNNIWANTGDVRVVYSADPNLYIDKRIAASKSIIAGVEISMVATKTYAIGDMLIVGDDLYKATAAITPDETIAVGTNVTKTTVAEQLIALASS